MNIQGTFSIDHSELQAALQVPDFDSLRSLCPEFPGQIVNLIGYHKCPEGVNPTGGGLFVGHLTAAKDDGGIIACDEETEFHWQRIVNDFSRDINILHFGAFMNGKDDDLPSVLRMFRYTRSVGTHLRRAGVRWPAGISYVSPYDYGPGLDFLVFSGPECHFGVAPQTQIISDGSLNAVFKACARRTVFHGLEWNGRATAEVDKVTRLATNVSNLQPFYQNLQQEGQYVNISFFRAMSAGGTVFDLMDTLDTEIQQFYAGGLYATFLSALYSNVKSWNHSTAVHLHNGNMQECYNKPVFDLRRVTQGIIDNVWVEKSRHPGDLENSGIDIRQFSAEGCVEPLNLKSAKGIHQQIQFQTGSSSIRGRSAEQWLGEYEEGYIRLDPQSAHFEASVRILWQSGIVRGSNNTGSPAWFHLGKVCSQKTGQQWEFKIKAKNGYGQANGTNILSTGEPGTTILKVQRGSADKPIVTMNHSGSNGILDCEYKPSNNDWVDIYIQVAAWCGEFDVIVESTGVTKAEQGACSLWIPDGTRVEQTPSKNDGGFVKALTVFSHHNGKAGIGAVDDRLQIRSKTGSPVSAATAAGFYELMGSDGKSVFLPYYR